MPLPASVKKAFKEQTRKRPPVWKGPEKDGITQSLVKRRLVCPERFRLRVIEGLAPPPTFRHPIEYGNMWHECEEAHAAGTSWKKRLIEYCRKCANEYPQSKEDIRRWFGVCKTQFPLYVEHWEENDDMRGREPEAEEQDFAVPYTLPSGRIVTMRGKWDSIDLVTRRRKKERWLQENKTKGQVIDQQLRSQLRFDLQSLWYYVALDEALKQEGDTIPLKGIRYNVIVRPLSGGKHSIKQRKGTKGKACNLKACRESMAHHGAGVPGCRKCNGVGRIGGDPAETDDAFFGRLGQEIEDNADFFFRRWNVEVTPEDITTFEKSFLEPVLENLWDDWEWWEYCHNGTADVNDFDTRSRTYPNHRARHFRMPYGVYSPLIDGGGTEYDEYLETGSKSGLIYDDNLFPEL